MLVRLTPVPPLPREDGGDENYKLGHATSLQQVSLGNNGGVGVDLDNINRDVWATGIGQ